MNTFEQEKPYRISFEVRDEYLYAYIEGEQDSFEISKQYWTDVSESLQRSGKKKVLVEENIVENGEMTDLFNLSTSLPDMGFSDKKIAFVDRIADQAELNSFGELVAVNRGLNVKIFKSVDEAEKWLLS
jgi:hypothetical protein